MEILLARPVVIAMALTGGVFSSFAMLLRGGKGRANLARRMDTAGYVFMGISMLLFVIVGFRGEV